MDVDHEESYTGEVSEHKKKVQEDIADRHMEQIIREKHKLNTVEFPVATRLLDEELKTTRKTGRAAFDDRYIDVYNEKPIKVQVRVLFPTKDVPTFNFVGKLLGPKGMTLKHLQEETKCKMFILGRGSMRDKEKEEECRKSNDPKFAHLSDELHVEVSCVAPPAEAHSRIAYALSQLRLVLVPDPPGYPYDEPVAVRGPPRLVDSKVKVMGFLEKARHAMDYQPPYPPRRFGHPPAYDEPFHRRDDDGYRRASGTHYPPRAAPYPRY